MVTCKRPAKMSPPEIRFKMPNWYYDKQALRETPSFLDGISNVKEMRYRREGARFIMKVGTKLGLKCETTASGIVYFHRFYMFHSFKQFPRFITSCCCLFLAGKVEETPKKCKQIISTASEFLTQKQLETFGDDPKEEVMTLERILLKTIKFDLQVAHPYHFILRYAKAIHGDRDTIGQMVQMAWTFINDSLQSTLCLQWEPEIIAIAAIYLASKLSNFEISDWQGRTSSQRRWWEAFASEVSVELLEDICHQILDLYSTANPDTPQDSPPDEEEVCPTPPRRPPQRPPSPPSKKEKKEEPHAPQESKKLPMPPMPPLAMGGTVAPPPPLPKEPQFYAPPPSEPPSAIPVLGVTHPSAPPPSSSQPGGPFGAGPPPIGGLTSLPPVLPPPQHSLSQQPPHGPPSHPVLQQQPPQQPPQPTQLAPLPHNHANNHQAVTPVIPPPPPQAAVGAAGGGVAVLGSGLYTRPPPPLPRNHNSQGPPASHVAGSPSVHGRPSPVVGVSPGGQGGYVPPGPAAHAGYFLHGPPPAVPPQDYSTPPPPPPHQYYPGNPHHHRLPMGLPPTSSGSAPGPGGPIRDHYRPSNQHHPYMRGQAGQGNPYLMPPQRR